MTRGSSRISESFDPLGRRRSAWLAGLLFYDLAGSGDFAYHLIQHLHPGNGAIEVSDVAVAFSAALFWPVDLIAMALLAAR